MVEKNEMIFFYKLNYDITLYLNNHFSPYYIIHKIIEKKQENIRIRPNSCKEI